MHPFISRGATVALACLLAATQGSDSRAAFARGGGDARVVHAARERTAPGGPRVPEHRERDATFASMLDEPASVPFMFVGLLALLGTRHLMPSVRRRRKALEQVSSTTSTS